MDLAVLIVGIIIGIGTGYFIWGPGREQMQAKDRTIKKPAKPGTKRPEFKNPNED